MIVFGHNGVNEINLLYTPTDKITLYDESS